MKIAHVIAYYQPQFGYQETYLSLEQKKMGHEVFVITSDMLHPGLFNKNERFIKPGKYEENGVTVFRLKTIIEIGTRPILKDLRNTLQEIQPDVVHCHDVFSFIPIQVAFLSKKLKFSLIYDTHAADFNTDARSSIYRKLSYILYRLTAGYLIKNRADYFVAVGENELEFLCRELILDKNNVPIIRLGTDSEFFIFDSNARNHIRKELYINDNDIVCVHCGKLSKRKNIEILIEAISRLRKKDSRTIKLLLIGSINEEYKLNLVNLADKLGIIDLIIFKGHVEKVHLPGLYSASDIAVWPGNISVSAIEAMSVGLPLITARDKYNEFLISNANGFLFGKGNVEDLIEKLEMLFFDSIKRHEMSKKSRELIEKELNWSSIAKKFISLYEIGIKNENIASD